ncbi:MAG: hypothetical protein KGI11_09585 [Thaumarchaeota archaeon]|nr:hypothetical protein [Nitrososphaerota archaeon]
MQSTSFEPKRLPLIGQQINRMNSITTDSRVSNGFIEKFENGEVWLYKRPGTASYLAPGSTGQGLGCYNWNGVIYSIRGTTLYSGTTSLGTVDGTSAYSFVSVLGGTPRLFFHNNAAAYYYSSTDGLVQLQTNNLITEACNITSGSTTVVVPANTITTEEIGATVTGTGIPAATTVASIVDTTHITISNAATATTTGVSLTFAWPSGYPISTAVPGCAYLDGTVYVLDSGGYIHGSDINQVNIWNPLNIILCQLDSDTGVALHRQLTYIIAFKQWTTEVFYDAGQSPGSPLGSVRGAKLNVGCASASSIQDIDGTLIWVTGSRSGAPTVMTMSNLQSQVISTPPVERLLQDANMSSVYSWNIKVAGHVFYGLTLKGSNVTLVYDFTIKEWYIWTDNNGNYFPYVSSTSLGNTQGILQHETQPLLASMDLTNYTDAGSVNFPVDLYTPNFDGGVKFNKMLKRMDVIGDQYASSNPVNITYSEDDYQTWSTTRTVDLSQKRPFLTDCGTFRRRAYHINHNTALPLRLKALEMYIATGSK